MGTLLECTMPEHEVDSPHVSEIVRKMSGFKPATIGRICDATNELAEKGERVYVELEVVEGKWEFIRMQKSNKPIVLDSSHPEAIQAVTTTEIMQVEGMMAVIGNPKVIDVSPKGEARGEWKEVLQ